MIRSGKLHVAATLAATAIVLLGAFAAGPAMAKGGGPTASGSGKHVSPTPTPVPGAGTIKVTLVSQSPVPLGTAPTFHGTGFLPGDTVIVMVSGYMTGGVIQADSTGSFTYTWWTSINIPGSYTFTAQTPDGRWGNVSFKVQ